MIASEPQNIFLPNFVWWCSIISQSVLWKKDSLLSSRSRSRWGLMWLKYDSFYYIFWTIDSLATKLGLMIHHHKPQCLVKKNRLLQSRSRSRQRVKLLMIVQTITSKPRIVMHHHEPECRAQKKKKVCYCQGQGHSEGSCDQNKTLSTIYIIFWPADSSATKLGLMIHHHKPERLWKQSSAWLKKRKEKKAFSAFAIQHGFSSYLPRPEEINFFLSQQFRFLPVCHGVL